MRIYRKTASLAASAVLAASMTACTSEVGGSASPGSGSQTSGSEQSSSGSEESSESSTSSGSEEPSGDTLQDVDGTFEITIPDGYDDVTDDPDLAGAALAIAESDPQYDFTTTILVQAISASGSTLEELTKTARENGEAVAGVAAEETSPPIDDIDGEDYNAYEFPPYESEGAQISSVVVVTIHNDTGYAITVNTSVDAISEAGSAYVDVIESWTWLD